MATVQSSSGMLRAGWIVTTLVILFLVFDATTKILRVAPVMEACAKVGIDPDLAVGVGAILLVCTAVYAIPQTSVVGMLLLTAYLGGAVMTHVRGGSGWIDIAFAVAFCGLAWLGVVLREPRVLWTILLRS